MRQALKDGEDWSVAKTAGLSFSQVRSHIFTEKNTSTEQHVLRRGADFSRINQVVVFDSLKHLIIHIYSYSLPGNAHVMNAVMRGDRQNYASRRDCR
jgi:hypothetical protein